DSLSFTASLSTTPRPPSSTLFPYTTLFRSHFLPDFPTPNGMAIDDYLRHASYEGLEERLAVLWPKDTTPNYEEVRQRYVDRLERSEEHTSELKSRENLVCRLLLEKKKHDKR